MPHVHHMPTSPADTHHILHQFPPRHLFPTLHSLRVRLRATLGMRVRHAEPVHADDAPGHVLPAFGAHGAGFVVCENGGAAAGGGSGGWNGRGGGGYMGGVAIEGLLAVAAFEGDLSGGCCKSRHCRNVAIGGSGGGVGGEFGGADVEADARDEEAVGVEERAVFGAPKVDERGREVARGGVGDGEDGGLEVVVFEDVGLKERDSLGGEAGQGEAFDVAVVGTFIGEGGDVGGEVGVGEVQEGNADAVVEGKVCLGKDGRPGAGADVGDDGEGVGIGGGKRSCYGGDC